MVNNIKDALKQQKGDYLYKKAGFLIELELLKKHPEDAVFATQKVKSGLLKGEVDKNITVKDRRLWIEGQIKQIDGIVEIIDGLL